MRQALFGPSVVFVLGGPGAGKGTQCTKIAAARRKPCARGKVGSRKEMGVAQNSTIGGAVTQVLVHVSTYRSGNPFWNSGFLSHSQMDHFLVFCFLKFIPKRGNP